MCVYDNIQYRKGMTKQNGENIQNYQQILINVKSNGFVN